jgi:hypothetical protein
MRSILLSGALAFSALTLAATPQAEASWLSQALRGNPGYGYYRAPNGPYGSSPVYRNGYGRYQPDYGYGARYGGYGSRYSSYDSPRYAAPYQYQTPYTYQRGYYQSAPYQYGVPQAYPRGYYQPAPYYYVR